MSAKVSDIRERRGSSRARLGLGPRARTVNLVNELNRRPRATRQLLEEGRVHLRVVDDLDAERPATRAACAGVQRPCPYVACRHNLYLDVDEDNGSIKFNFPDLEPDEVDPRKSCALDIAADGGATLEDVAETMNVTRERVRQMEVKALALVKKRGKILREFSDAPDDAEPGVRSDGQGSVLHDRATGAGREDASEDDEPPTRISFFADGERADEHVCAAVWRMHVKSSRSRGIEVSNKSAAIKPWRSQSTPGETMASREDGLTDRQKTILSAYQAYAKEHGEPPSNGQLVKLAKIEGATEESRLGTLGRELSVLREQNLVGPPRRGPRSQKAGAAPAPKPTPKPRPTAPAAAPPAPPRRASKDPTVAALIEKRDAFLTKAKALDVAIEALSEAL